jgi:plasmid stability protein
MFGSEWILVQHAQCMQFEHTVCMPDLQIRNFPASLHRLLLERARQEGRTIAQQATVLLTEALAVSPTPRERRRAVLAELSRSRKRFDFTRIASPEELIRVDRNR